MAAVAGYSRIPDASLRGACNLHVLGSPRLLFDSLTFHREALETCAATCSSAVDCVAFVYHREDRLCTFKATGAEPGSSCTLAVKYGRDVYLKKRLVPAVAVEGDLGENAERLAPHVGRLNETRVHAIPAVVTEHEAAALREFAVGCFRRASTRGADAAPPASTSDVATLGSNACKAVGDAAVSLARLEKRISRLTGLPSHAGEEPLLLTRQRPSAAAAWLDGSRMHHDRINAAKAGRAVTVLVYLDSVTDAQGGHTIVPTLPARRRDEAAAAAGRGSDDGGSDDAGRARMEAGEGGDGAPAERLSVDRVAEVVGAAYGRGTRSLGCIECAQHADPPPTADEMADADAVHSYAEAECRRALVGRARSLAVRPQAGHALLWWHALRNGSADAHVWHAGCVGRSGTGRLAVQKFKTPLAAQAAARLQPDAVVWRQRIISEAERLDLRQAAVAPLGGDGGGVMEAEEESFDEEDFWAKMDQAMARISRGE